MAPRTLTLIILATTIALGSPVSAKEKRKPAKQAVRTWKAVAEYVLKNGSEKPIEAPASRTLNYDKDTVAAKSLRIKSSISEDKKEHTIRVTYTLNEKGLSTPIDINLGTILVKTGPDGRSLDAYIVRINLEGDIISALHATGLVGEVEQTRLAPDSTEVVATYKSESALHLKPGALERMSQ